MLTADDIAEGFYRVKDLRDLRIISTNADLKNKQDRLNFPKPIKVSPKVALYPKAEITRWLLAVAAKRDAAK